jgi:hypothetical protein
MQLSFDYDSSYFPAFPVAEITIRSTKTSREVSVTGLIDSGADATQIPLSILHTIGARKLDERWVRDLSEVRFLAPLYAVEIRLGPVVLYGMEVVGRNQTTEVIIGRDVLNQLIVTLNGLAFVKEIQD